MKDFEGAVTVVTGGAGGLGLALAKAAQARGSQLVIADLREDALESAEAELSAGGEVLAVRTDVSQAEDVEALAAAAVQRFGKVNLLFNNAGVFASGVSWETSAEEYNWVVGVNQLSVVHGIRSFVPRMIAQGDECHVVTVSSGAGITVNPGFCTYSMTKHAALALTESLWLDLRAQEVPNIGVTVVLPGMSRSGIMTPEKTAPPTLQDDVARRRDNSMLTSLELMMQAGVSAGLPAEELAERVFTAIEEDALYVLPAHDDEGSRAFATAIGTGRANGVNAYPPFVDALLDTLRGVPAND
ncbi:SDR family NAD(P)-dependent oxidoreductase [Nocardioides insulae]|uniref:SDR family NAD(P)-dependent oxidoreductase n=1 Tax=Nocardioides insulae TaxID=394734 RepID=UPI000401C6F4|nr:SDR family NAD(P)-dependent oxidoreductase [Nocardioides insulae]